MNEIVKMKNENCIKWNNWLKCFWIEIGVESKVKCKKLNLNNLNSKRFEKIKCKKYLKLKM